MQWFGGPPRRGNLGEGGINVAWEGFAFVKCLELRDQPFNLLTFIIGAINTGVDVDG